MDWLLESLRMDLKCGSLDEDDLLLIVNDIIDTCKTYGLKKAIAEEFRRCPHCLSEDFDVRVIFEATYYEPEETEKICSKCRAKLD